MKKLILISFILIGVSSLQAQSRQELEKRKASTQEELALAKELLDKTRDRKQSSVRRVSLLNRGISKREKLIQTILEEINLLDEEVSLLESEIEDIEKNIEEGKEEYARLLYSIYRSHTEEDKMMYLLASENINQFYQRIKYLKYLKDYRERKVRELELLSIVKQERTDELIRIRNTKADLLNEQETENRQLVSERTRRNNIIRQLAQDERRIRREIEEKEKMRKELEEKIRKIIEEEARKSSANSLAASLTPEQKLVGNSFLQNKGRLPWPVERGVITASYGLINHPVLSGVKISNNGIDITTQAGEKARAIFDGEVTSVFAILGANYAVIVMHGEYLSVYQNLEKLTVKAGDKVVTKQELGTIHNDSDENTGVLHLQIWKSKEIQDPENWLSK